MLYERNDMNFSRGKFRVRGDVVEVYPATADEEAIRLEFFGDGKVLLAIVVTTSRFGSRSCLNCYCSHC